MSALFYTNFLTGNVHVARLCKQKQGERVKNCSDRLSAVYSETLAIFSLFKRSGQTPLPESISRGGKWRKVLLARDLQKSSGRRWPPQPAWLCNNVSLCMSRWPSLTHRWWALLFVDSTERSRPSRHAKFRKALTNVDIHVLRREIQTGICALPSLGRDQEV